MRSDRLMPTRRRGRRRSRVATAIALAATLALAACGGDDGNSNASGGGGDGGKLGKTNVGVLVPLTGELGDFGKSWQEAANLARDQINAASTDLKIETMVADEKTNAQVGVTEARRLISQKDVAAIVGPTSEIMVALAPIAKREEVPVISGAAGTVQLNKLGGDWLFRTVASDDADGVAIAKYLHAQDAQDVVMVVEQQGSLPSIGAAIANSFKNQGGSVKGTVTFNPGQSSYRTEVGNVLKQSPGWIVCACGQESGANIIKEVHSSGYDGKWMLSSDNATSDTIKTVGADVIEGMHSETPSTDTKSAEYKAFAKAYEDKYGSPPELLVANVYDATMLAALAMVKAGSTDGPAVRDALREVANPPGKKVSTFEDGLTALKAGEDIDFDGASGPVDFDDTGTVASSYTILEAKSGKWQPIEFYPASDIAELLGA